MDQKFHQRFWQNKPLKHETTVKNWAYGDNNQLNRVHQQENPIAIVYDGSVLRNANNLFGCLQFSSPSKNHVNKISSEKYSISISLPCIVVTAFSCLLSTTLYHFSFSLPIYLFLFVSKKETRSIHSLFCECVRKNTHRVTVYFWYLKKNFPSFFANFSSLRTECTKKNGNAR